MAIASANARARTIFVVTADWASGFRPIASTALEPIRPIPIPGPSAPIAMASAVANIFIASGLIDEIHLLSKVCFNDRDSTKLLRKLTATLQKPKPA